MLTIALSAFLPFFLLAESPPETAPQNEVDPRTVALLCADQADNRIRLIAPATAESGNRDLWVYPTEDGKRFKYMPTDAKRVEVDGAVHVLAAYHGRVQLVRFSDQKVIADFASYSSCHSAELLPDGAIVTASSNHGKLRIHHSAEEFADLDLPYAHGVTWDKKRKCLWAVGDFLYRLSYKDGKLDVEKKYQLPISPTGHDLFPLQSEAKLLVSNNEALFLFDIAREKFEKTSELKGIKSASQHLDGSLWASDTVSLEGAAEWQTDAVIRIRPRIPPLRYRNEGSRFYKARWWQKVEFSQ